MATRVLTLLLFIYVAGSSAELRSPFFRARRNGLQDSSRPPVMDLAAGASRIKRQSNSSDATESTTTPKTADNPTTVYLRNTNLASASTVEPDPITEPTFNTNPSTSSIPDSGSTTSDTTKSSSTTSGTSKPSSTTTNDTLKPSSTTSGTPKPSLTTNNTPKSSSTISDTPKPSSTTNGTPKPSSTIQSTTKSMISKPKYTTSVISATKSTTPKPVSMTSSPTTIKSTGSAETIEKSNNSVSSAASPVIGLRFNPPEDEPQGSSKKYEQESNGGNPMNLGFENSPFLSFFVPTFVPDFSAPYNPYNLYNPYGNPIFNSIPSTGNYAPTGSNSEVGGAMSFASASASSGASSDADYNKSPVVVYRGGFVENEPNTVNTAVYGGNGRGTPFDSSAFVFPDYNIESIQRQVEEGFKRIQAQIQQQQAIFEATNRIGSDGYPGASGPGVHSAISSIGLGPQGGYQSGAINPAAPGVQSRFGEELPPPSGNSYGVFSSSSSHSRVGPDGKTVSHKVATTGVNDNGKITFRTVQD